MNDNEPSSQTTILFIAIAVAVAFVLLYVVTQQLFWLLLLLLAAGVWLGYERYRLTNRLKETTRALGESQTAQKSLQAQLTQSDQQLKLSSRELERIKRTAVLEAESRNRFWRHISHELRTPLNGIINFSHMIGLGFYGDVSDRQVNYLTRIEQSGWYLLNMLNDLSDLAKIETGELTLNEVPLDLFVVCEESLATLHSLLTDDSVQVVRNYPEAWPVFHGDERRLKQILVNLLRHAAKQIEEGFIALNIRADGQQLQIIVEDSAGGMTAEQVENLFFEIRANSVSSLTQSSGVSFGLSVAKHLVEAHRGTLTVKTEHGIGSQFVLTFPLERSG